MVFELLAPRLLAPWLGSSVEVWTAVIACLVSGYVVGNVIGGKWADREPSLKKMSWLLLLVAVWFALMPWSVTWIGSVGMGASWSIWVSCLLLFLCPTVVLAMVFPFVLKREAQSFSDLGRRLGGMGMWSALGSLIGVYGTGFFLLAYVSTTVILFLLAGLTVCLSLLMRRNG